MALGDGPKIESERSPDLEVYSPSDLGDPLGIPPELQAMRG